MTRQTYNTREYPTRLALSLSLSLSLLSPYLSFSRSARESEIPTTKSLGSRKRDGKEEKGDNASNPICGNIWGRPLFPEPNAACKKDDRGNCSVCSRRERGTHYTALTTRTIATRVERRASGPSPSETLPHARTAIPPARHSPYASAALSVP